RIIHFPARSFTDCPGFMNSALPRMVQPVISDALFNLMRGVFPIASMTSLLMFMGVISCQSAGNPSSADPRARSAKVEAGFAADRALNVDRAHDHFVKPSYARQVIRSWQIRPAEHRYFLTRIRLRNRRGSTPTGDGIGRRSRAG